MFPTRRPIPVNSNFYAGRIRSDKIDFLKKSKEYRNRQHITAARLCESRHLCELGLNAVVEKDETSSVHMLYKALWKISNEYFS